jgi:hypothetical protein
VHITDKNTGWMEQYLIHQNKGKTVTNEIWLTSILEHSKNDGFTILFYSRLLKAMAKFSLGNWISV